MKTSSVFTLNDAGGGSLLQHGHGFRSGVALVRVESSMVRGDKTNRVRRELAAALMGLACVALGSRADASSSPAAQAAVEDAANAALQADAARAVELLRAVPEKQFEGKDRSFRSCMLERFGAADPATAASRAAALPDQVLAAYRAYWRRSLLNPAAREAEETRLLAVTRRLLGPATKVATEEEVGQALTERMRAAGLHVQLGRTLPLLELLVWSREDVAEHVVALPDREYRVRLVVLDDFRSLGWGDWSTCGRYGAGGWADEQALYLVRPRYERIDDEAFLVSYLAHETQHLADRRTFPDLDAWQLEYRAKLTELALARSTRKDLLESFGANQGDDSGVPHPYANRRVLADLRAQLGSAGADLGVVPEGALQAAARAVLRADTQQRQQTLRGTPPTP